MRVLSQPGPSAWLPVGNFHPWLWAAVEYGVTQGGSFFCSRSLEKRAGCLRPCFRRFGISPCCRDAHHHVFPFVGWTGEKLDLLLLAPTRAAAFAPVEVLLWAEPGLGTSFFLLFFCLRFLRVRRREAGSRCHSLTNLPLLISCVLSG